MKKSIKINKIENIEIGLEQKLIKNFAEQIANKEINRNYKINLIFVDNSFITRLNREFFNRDEPTDVISFDLSGKNSKSLEGEVYIGTERVNEQASEYNVKFSEELLRITAHGILHLAGYRDDTEKNRKIMFKKQENYLKNLIDKDMLI